MQSRAPSLWTPALIGGAVFGFLAAVPVVNMLNCLCCALILGAGFTAGALLANASKTAGVAFGAAEGTKVGVLAGLMYAVFTSVFQWILSFVVPHPDPAAMLEMIDQFGGEIPPAARQWIEQIASGELSTWMFLVGFFFSLAFGLVFATLGGLIAGAAFRHRPTPPEVPASPPPSAGQPPLGTPHS